MAAAPGGTHSSSSCGTASYRRQKRMGPAPFASFEDLSDELESSPDDAGGGGASVVRLPGIREDATPISTPGVESTSCGISLIGASAKGALGAPRIDISRASSSSQKDSKDSTPENMDNPKLGLGFREEGALDLRLSTEELDFQEQANAKNVPADETTLSHQRKDSQGSEFGLLCISGRTSRLSSIGSQGSAQSRLSNASHLSVISGQSGLSRSPSPHKMLLETSFCGAKRPEGDRPRGDHASTSRASGSKADEDLEKLILARKQDPREASMAEGISVVAKPETHAKSDIKITVNEARNSQATTPKLPKRIISKSGVEYIYIPLKGPLPPDDEALSVKSKPIREVRSAGATPKGHGVKKNGGAKSTSPSPVLHPRKKLEDEPRYIRIRLKPDHMYSQDDNTSTAKPNTLDLNTVRKTCDYNNINLDAIVVDRTGESSMEPTRRSHDVTPRITPCASPKLQRHLVMTNATKDSKTPSPSLSRKSSFASSIFKSKETIGSPESPTVPNSSRRRKNTIGGILREASDSLRDRSRSRSKSRERDTARSLSAAPSSSESIDSGGRAKPKSVFSIFKAKKPSECPTATNHQCTEKMITNLEFKFNERQNKETPLGGDSIRIPLHSPTHYEERSLLQDNKTSSQDSQDTVIEVIASSSNKIETGAKTTTTTSTAPRTSTEETKRQSSTSSDNVIFSTNLGSNNDLFTTKLPKPDKESATPPCTTPTLNGHPPSLWQSNNKSKNDEDVMFRDESNKSSESGDSELDLATDSSTIRLNKDLRLALEVVEPERKGLVLQQEDSYEEAELPYVPTTLPQERSAAIPIVPVKQRSSHEVKTCSIERPRSTTPINPSCLEDYCEEVAGSFNLSENATRTIEKLRISLPKHDSVSDQSPRKPTSAGSTNKTTWFDFAERGGFSGRRDSSDTTPPPLPPKPPQRGEWINFEEIPERRRPPKRIQTLPPTNRRTSPSQNVDCADNVVVYNYVNPEECRCECHERGGGAGGKSDNKEEEEQSLVPEGAVQEDELPLLDADEGGGDEDNGSGIKVVGLSDRLNKVR